VGNLGAREVCCTVTLYFATRNVLIPIFVNRIVNLGCPRRQLATENPKARDLLPVEDAVWNEGVSFPGTITIQNTNETGLIGTAPNGSPDFVFDMEHQHGRLRKIGSGYLFARKCVQKYLGFHLG
jgi:hypothetical protein